MKIKKNISLCGVIITFISLMLVELSFGENNPPDVPTNPSPAMGATNQSVNLVLGWDCQDTDGDLLTYEVYFGTYTSPPLIGTTNYEYYIPNTLTNDTWYYWEIKATDIYGSFTTGPVWMFKTIDNKSPAPPVNFKATDISWDQIVLSWQDDYDDELGFVIYRSMSDNGPYGTLTTLGANITSYCNQGLNQLTTYYYKIRVYDGFGYSDYSNVAFATTPMKPELILYNNLFDPTKGEKMTIKYKLSFSSHVKIKIYTLDGELVKTVVNENKEGGIEHQVYWDGKDEKQEIVASGIYLVHIKAESFKDIKKAAVIK